jgi:hypothetical protein
MTNPLCKSPDHPPEAPRDQMVLVDEKRAGNHGAVTHRCFACVPCRDIRRVLSVQVQATPEFKAFINAQPEMQQYKRARLVERDPTSGRIKYFR